MNTTPSMPESFKVGDTVYLPEYGVGTVLSIIKEGTPITVYGDTIPNPGPPRRTVAGVLIGVEFVGTRMAIGADRLVKYLHKTINHNYEGIVTYAVHPDYENLFNSNFDPLSNWLRPNVPGWAAIRL
jgi:hypothetical protein